MRTWEETIKFIRTQPEYKELVAKAYFEEDLVINIERFNQSDEFLETLNILKEFAPNAKTILDVGSGNGISAISFALLGFEVTVCEPDLSDTIGAGAIEQMRKHYKLHNLQIIQDYAENVNLPNLSFDLVYVRQAMHHAHDLDKFIKNVVSLLKPNGHLLTIRDHVIFDDEDKQRFLEDHPLHKYYGGENAFKPEQYRNAMQNAGLNIIREIKYYDSQLNYFPRSKADIEAVRNARSKSFLKSFINRFGVLRYLPGAYKLYKWKNRKMLVLDEKEISGRMYSYIAKKI